MKSQQNTEKDKEVNVVVVVVITVVVMVAVIVSATAIVVRPIIQRFLVASPTPIAENTGDATIHQLAVLKKLRFTEMMPPGKIAWGDRIIFVSIMWNDRRR